MVNSVLAAKAAYLEEAILAKCVDPDGFLLWFTRRPDLEPADDVIRQIEWKPHVPDVERGAFYGYENSNQQIANYLQGFKWSVFEPGGCDLTRFKPLTAMGFQQS